MIAYFDCFSGISGDMTLGALVDLGVDPQWLEDSLRALPLEEIRLDVAEKRTMGIAGKKVDVVVERESGPRDYSVIRNLIQQGNLSPWVRRKGLEIFQRLAHAEARVHGMNPEHVHFHEVGGADAIADILGSLMGLERLGIREVHASPLPHGTGFVQCAHGVLPVPAPATVLLLEGCPTYGTDVPCELVTPTGAAIISALARRFGPPPAMAAQGVGYGLGSTQLPSRPNCLRIIMGETVPALETDRVLTLETNIDDMNPEIFGHVQEALFGAGALDVAWIALAMKKNRPGTLVRVLCPPEAKDALVRVLLSETTATGVRFWETFREKLVREPVTLQTPLGAVRAKRIVCLDGSVRVTPEYEACREIARDKGLPLIRVYEIIAAGSLPETG